MPGCRTSSSWLVLRRGSGRIRRNRSGRATSAIREVHMLSNFHASATMFVFLKGHHLLEYYFSVSDSRSAANDFIRSDEQDNR
jgi:hypothetical protein